MKKIISVIVALSIVASLGLTCVFAAEPTDITFVCAVSEIAEGDLGTFLDEADVATSVGYILTFTLTGVEDDEISWQRKGTVGSYTYAGRTIDAATLTLLSDIDNSNFVKAFSSDEGHFYTNGTIKATTFDGLTITDAGKQMLPSTASGKSGAIDLADPFVVFYVFIPKGVEMNLTPEGTIKINDWVQGKTDVDGSSIYSNETDDNLLFADESGDPLSVITLGTSGGGGGGDPETYIVEFLDYDGETQLGYDDDYEEGDPVTAPADPTRLGWTFTGWSDGVNTYAGNEIPDVGNDNVTYTATYSQNHYTITFNDYNDAQISSDSTYVYGATVTPPADPTRVGWTFTGWDPAVTTVTADAVYTATYSKDPVYAESIMITGDTLTNVSTTVQLDYEVDPSEAVDTVDWSIVSGPATISDSGLVTPTGDGVVEVQITASPSGATDTHTIKVVADAVAPTVEETNLYLTATELVEKKYDDGNYYHVSDATISSADTTNYIYKAWAKEYGSEEKHYFELPEDIDAVNEFLNVEASGAALNFILMIKSATHKIIAAGIDAVLNK